MLTALFLLAASVPVVEHARNPDTGSESWSIRTQGVALTLAQMLPDQVRGFYAARGFEPEAIEYLATRHCVFQTVLRNEAAGGPIRFDLGEWRVHAGAETRRLKLVRDWLPEWQRRGVAEGARLAFRWALFPSGHTYAVGDWNMGMTTYALPLGTRFDLRIAWWHDAERHEALLRGARCASEAAAGPQS